MQAVTASVVLCTFTHPYHADTYRFLTATLHDTDCMAYTYLYSRMLYATAMGTGRAASREQLAHWVRRRAVMRREIQLYSNTRISTCTRSQRTHPRANGRKGGEGEGEDKHLALTYLRPTHPSSNLTCCVGV
jgi:hypothetical protein